MTILDNGTRNQYTATAGQTVFVYDFEIFESGDIRVYRNAVMLALTTDYTLSGVGDENGGNVTLTSGATAGDIYTIFRKVTPERTTEYQESGQFLAQELNDDFDRLWAVIQDQETAISRTLQLTDQTTASLPLFLEDGTAGNLLRWNDTATGIDNVTPSTITPSAVIGTDFNIRRTNYAAVRLIDTSTVADGQVVTVTNDGIAGDFVLRNSAGHGLADNGGTIIVIDSNWYAERIYQKPYLDAKWFGAAIDGSTDDTAIIQSTLSIGPVLVSGGTAAIDGMIEVGFNQELFIGAEATLKRFSANTANTDPVIWIRGNNAIVAGAGLTRSFVVTENRCPLGVIRQGHRNMTESDANVNYTTLRDLGIFGSTDGGQTSGNPDVCVYRANPTIGTNLDSFFATLKNLRLNSANYGIQWQGDANADTVENVYGQNLGNATLTSDRAMFSLEGCADHKFSNCFFHLSAGSDMLVFKDLDNSGTPGGKIHVGPSACSFVNMVGEQSAPGRWLVAEDGVTSGARNVVQGVDNSGGGFAVGETWLASNTVNNSDGHFQRRRISINGAIGETGTSVRMTGDTPSYFLNEQDQALDEKKWDLVCAQSQLRLRAISDDELDASNVMTVDRTAGSIDSITFGVGPNSVSVGRFDANATSGETRFMLYDVSAGTMVRVSRGNVDSGGAGFRVLRVPN